MSNKNILITGGAGYIGSHTVSILCSIDDFNIIVLDNLSNGHEKNIDIINTVRSPKNKVIFRKGDIADTQLVSDLFKEFKFDAVIHFAAFAYVGESVKYPLKYYENNIAKPIQLLKVMEDFECKKFILSSTCAIYGDPEYMPLDEDHPKNPVNPYGMSKLMLENVLKDCSNAWGLSSVCLRYFNASGCSLDSSIGECHKDETHLIPLVIYSLLDKIKKITIFGQDYPTQDGTCIRDYIHVLDLADAHIKAFEYLSKKDNDSIGNFYAFNLGTGKGYSVKEIINKCAEISAQKVPTSYGNKRDGDPPELIANSKLINQTLKWSPQYSDIDTIIKSAWNWYKSENYKDLSS